MRVSTKKRDMGPTKAVSRRESDQRWRHPKSVVLKDKLEARKSVASSSSLSAIVEEREAMTRRTKHEKED